MDNVSSRLLDDVYGDSIGYVCRGSRTMCMGEVYGMRANIFWNPVRREGK